MEWYGEPEERDAFLLLTRVAVEHIAATAFHLKRQCADAGAQASASACACDRTSARIRVCVWASASACALAPLALVPVLVLPLPLELAPLVLVLGLVFPLLLEFAPPNVLVLVLGYPPPLQLAPDLLVLVLGFPLPLVSNMLVLAPRARSSSCTLFRAALISRSAFSCQPCEEQNYHQPLVVVAAEPTQSIYFPTFAQHPQGRSSGWLSYAGTDGARGDV